MSTVMDSSDLKVNSANSRKRPQTNFSVEVTARGPLTRSRRALLDKASEELSGNKLTSNGSQDEDIQAWNSHLDTGSSWSERGEGTHVGVQKSSKNAMANEDPEITRKTEQHLSDSSSVLPKKATKPPGVPTRDATETTSLRSRQKLLVPQATASVTENQGTVNGPSLERPDVNNKYVPVSKNITLVRPNLRRRQTAHPEKEESTRTRTSTSNKRRPESSWRSIIWRVTCLILLLTSAAVLSYMIPSVWWSSDGGKINLSRAVKLEQFHELLTTLENSFPHQRNELWHKSKIHLEKHLKTKEPTEPVSLILTAGRDAEKTLRCLAQGVASSFSSALNASVLSIDGATLAGNDGDEVKLGIDIQLRAAFEGEKPAVVIHRLEELPPSSTLIFYRYCDHENAAYKKVFLLFTVLLPRDEITSDQSVKEVEELVQDHLLQKLVDSNITGFNKMDANKFSGLWSRISHLILPVVSEEPTEKTGCEL